MSTTVQGPGSGRLDTWPDRDRLEISVTPDGEEKVVGVKPEKVIGTTERVVIAISAVIAALGWGAIALHRDEQISSVWLVLAAIGSYLIGYTLYARLIDYHVVLSLIHI